jgi:hypothetical protein
VKALNERYERIIEKMYFGVKHMDLDGLHLIMFGVNCFHGIYFQKYFQKFSKIYNKRQSTIRSFIIISSGHSLPLFTSNIQNDNRIITRNYYLESCRASI